MPKKLVRHRRLLYRQSGIAIPTHQGQLGSHGLVWYWPAMLFYRLFKRKKECPVLSQPPLLPARQTTLCRETKSSNGKVVLLISSLKRRLAYIYGILLCLQKKVAPLSHIQYLQKKVAPLSHIQYLQKKVAPLSHIQCLQKKVAPLSHIQCLQKKVAPLSHIQCL
jgi:hypothetical protein